MNRSGAIKKPVRDDLCVVCHYGFSSHEWFLPAGVTAEDGCVGHDYTPIQGPPVRHPSKKPISLGQPKRNETEGEK